MAGFVLRLSLLMLVSGALARMTARLPSQADHAAFYRGAGRRLMSAGLVTLAGGLVLGGVAWVF